MSEAPPGSVTIEVRREWDGHLLRTSHLRPQDSVAVLIGYRLDPWPVDSGMPPIVAEAFGRALPRFGMIAGRWLGRAPPHGELQFLPANRPLLQRIVRRLTGQWLADLVLTCSPATTIDLFGWGWDMQWQFLLVIDPACKASPADALAALRRPGRWDRYILVPPVIAAIAPGVDGDYALLAADSEQRLSAILAALGRDFTAAGFQIKSA